MEEERKTLAIKAGLWYTISNFAIRAISIISTPIFTRMMSLSEYGDYSNFVSWLNIITILTTMDLHASINRARFDFPEETNEYVSSITLISIIIPSFVYLVAVNLSDLFQRMLGMDMISIHCMFLSIIFSSAINIFQAKQRVLYRYRESVIMTLVSTIITIGASLLLVYLMQNKYYGRVIGQTIPAMFLNIGIAVYLISKGRSIKLKYVKYALWICLPYVPHLLAINILSQYDRIQIKSFCGSEEVALYSLAYSCALVINIFLNSLNNAWTPWMGDKIHEKNLTAISRASKKYIMIFIGLAIGIFLIAPELLYFFGGSSYAEAIYVMPPVITGSVFQFIYTLYVNVEMFEKKVWGVALATGIAAVLNIFLNSLFIPRYGYIAASFTTLFCYAILVLLHYLLVRRLKMQMIYNTKFIVLALAFSLTICFLMYYIYNIKIVRYTLIAIYICAFAYLLVRNKNYIEKVLKKK